MRPRRSRSWVVHRRAHAAFEKLAVELGVGEGEACDTRPRALVGDVLDVDAGHRLQELAAVPAALATGRRLSARNNSLSPCQVPSGILPLRVGVA